MFTGDLLPALKRLRRVVDHAPPSGADFKNKWSFNSITPHAVTAHTESNLFHLASRHRHLLLT
jgi:hypothetical protein